jgi:predicted NBD/HSP70 family sugar kinase
LAAEIEGDGWGVALVELGGRIVEANRGRHRSHRPEVVLRNLEARIRAARDEHGRRLSAIGVSVAGAVQGERLAQLDNLGWRNVDVREALHEVAEGLPVVVGNDASLGGLAEALRGAGTDAKTLLHLRVQDGIGGVVVEQGRPVLGATGAAGEFGHLPMGNPARRCPCGARGCWGLEVSGAALARALHAKVPRDSFLYGQQVMERAREGDASALGAVREVATALGAGIGGLVNALDPDVVTVGGLGTDVLELAGKQLRSAYVSGLMAFRRSAPPPIRSSHLSGQGPLVGAAEAAFERVLTESGVDAWNRG